MAPPACGHPEDKETASSALHLFSGCGPFALFNRHTILDHCPQPGSGLGKRHGFGRRHSAQAVRSMPPLQ
jgi:hypothetical protein